MSVAADPRLCPADPAIVGYTFVRHIGFILDELSSQGLDLWRDEGGGWRWRWLATELQAERGFWAVGEALVDAVVHAIPICFRPRQRLPGVCDKM